jgi:cephalosporin hydroxylase
MKEVNRRGYSYNFSWLGYRIIQYPQHMIALTESVHSTKPDAIVETGVAHGGSLVFFASLLALEEIHGGSTDWKVVGVEIDLRMEARKALSTSPFARRISVVEGSSTDDHSIQGVRDVITGAKRVMVVLDSNHGHDHVLHGLRQYSKFVSTSCYLVVLDTVIEMIGEHRADRSWRVGSNAYTAVAQFLEETDEFVVDSDIDHRLVVLVAPRGYLRRIRE